MAIFPKNIVLNWEVPVIKRYTKQGIPSNMLLLRKVDPKIHGTKYSKKSIDFKEPAFEKYIKEGVKGISLAFDKDRLFICFNPPPGTPFFRIKKNGTAHSIHDCELIEKIYNKFKLDHQKKAYLLKVYHYGKIGEVDLHVLTPQHYDSKLPVYEEELNGNLAVVR